MIGLVGQIVKNGQEGWWTGAEDDRDGMTEGIDTDVRQTVPTDATVGWGKSDSFVTGTSTINLVALPVEVRGVQEEHPDLPADEPDRDGAAVGADGDPCVAGPLAG